MISRSPFQPQACCDSMTIQKSFCQLQVMAYRLEPENGETEGSITAGILHLLSGSMLLTPRDDHQLLGLQNEVTNGYNKAYNFSKWQFSI